MTMNEPGMPPPLVESLASDPERVTGTTWGDKQWRVHDWTFTWSDGDVPDVLVKQYGEDKWRVTDQGENDRTWLGRGEWTPELTAISEDLRSMRGVEMKDGMLTAETDGAHLGAVIENVLLLCVVIGDLCLTDLPRRGDAA